MKAMKVTFLVLIAMIMFVPCAKAKGINIFSCSTSKPKKIKTKKAQVISFIKDNDLKEYELNGKVKCIETVYFVKQDKDNKNEDTIGIVAKDKNTNQSFDTMGFETKHSELNNGKLTYIEHTALPKKRTRIATTYWVDAKDTNQEAEIHVAKKAETIYDQEGYPVRMNAYDSSANITYYYQYEYSEKHDTVRCLDFEKDKDSQEFILNNIGVNTFNEKGSMTTEGNYNADSSWFCRCDFQFDKDGHQTECMAMINGKEMEFKRTTTYNADGTKNIEYVYLPNKEDWFSKTIYTYDSHKNYTQSITIYNSSRPSSIVKRQIIYY